MNPRVVLLLSIAALFIAMWSMDSQHQTAVMLSRKAKSQATMVQKQQNDSAPATLLSVELTVDETRSEVLTYAEHESVQDAADKTVMGWDCFPRQVAGETSRESNDTVSLPSQTILVSSQTHVAPQTVATEPAANEAAMSESEFECSKCNWRRDEVPMDSLWIFGGIDIPLPEEITAGEYRIVSDRGDIRSLTLVPAELAYHGRSAQSTPRDLYHIEVDNIRWYFIRIKHDSTKVETATASADWKSTAAAIGTWFNSDMRLTMWRWSSRWERLQRQVNAIGRQSQTWSNAMTQALWHTVRAIEAAKRTSAQEAPSGSRL